MTLSFMSLPAICNAEDDLYKAKNYFLEQELNKIENDTIQFNLKFKSRNSLDMTGNINTFNTLYENDKYIIISQNKLSIDDNYNTMLIYRQINNNIMYGINISAERSNYKLGNKPVNDIIGLELENNRFRIQYDYYSYIHSQKIYSDAGEHTTINYNLNDYLKLNYTHQNFDRVKSNYGIDFQLDKRTNISFIHDNGHGYKVYVYYDVFGDKNSFLNKKAIQHKIDNKQHIKHEII